MYSCTAFDDVDSNLYTIAEHRKSMVDLKRWQTEYQNKAIVRLALTTLDSSSSTIQSVTVSPMTAKIIDRRL